MTYKRYIGSFKENLHIALPVSLGYLGHVFVGVMDNVFVGKLDPVNLAAVSLANSGIFFIMSFGIGFSYAIMPLVSEGVGSGNKSRMQKVLFNGLFLNTIIGLITLLLSLGIPTVMRWLHQPPEVISLAAPYARIVGISLLFVMIFQAFKQFSDGMALTRYPMTATLIANVLNIGLSYILVFGKLGFHPMGIYGAAYGTLAARVITAGLLWLIMKRLPGTAAFFRHWNKRLFSRSVIQKILHLGIPSAFQGVFEMGIFSATVWIAGTLGSIPQAANQIGLQVASLTFMVYLGFGVTATVRVGNMKGKKDYTAIQHMVKNLFVQILVLETLFAVLIMLFSPVLPALFLDDYTDPDKIIRGGEIFRIATQVLVVVGIFQLADGIQVITQGALRGLQDVVIPFYITFVAYWLIGFPVSWWLGKYYGATGIWMGLSTGLSSAAMMLGLRFVFLTKKLNTTN